MRVLLVLVAILAAAYAECLGQGFADAYKAGTGITPVNVNVQLQASTIDSLPICGNTDAFPKQTGGGYLTCCTKDAFEQIRDLAREYTVQLNTLSVNSIDFDQYKNALDQAQSKLCDNPQTAAYCDAFKAMVSVLKKFIPAFTKHYPTCAAAYRDYLEGAFCAVCNPNFFPEIAVRDGSKITFTWAPATCTSFASACSPVIEDLYNFINEFFAAFSNINLGTGTLAPVNGVDFLANIPGDTTADKIKNWLCNYQLAGVYTVDFAGVGSIAGSLGGSLGGAGFKRDEMASIIQDHAKRLRDVAGTLVLRQSSSSSGNAYNGTYNPIAVGQQTKYMGSGSSAASLTVCIALIVAMLALYLF